MSNIKDQVSEEIKNAMRAKDKTKLNALRYVKKLFIENETSKSPKPEQDIVIGYVKKLKDSLTIYPADSDQFKDLEKEIDVLSDYMPKELTEQDVKTIIEEIIKEQDTPQFGMIMKELSPKIKGRYDGKKATDLVKSMIN